MTKQDVLKSIELSIKLNQKEHDGLMEELRKDFLYRFSWNSERMYKTMKLNHHLGYIRDSVQKCEDNEVEAVVNIRIERFKKALISFYPEQSTNPISNTTSLWDFECLKSVHQLLLNL